MRSSRDKKALGEGKEISFGDSVYSADIYVGSQYHTSNVIFSTLQVRTAIESLTCSNCLGTDLFDKSSSTSYSNVDSENVNQWFSDGFDRINYNADTGFDTLCLTD